MNAILVKGTEGNEALYLDGALYSEGDPIHEGSDRATYFADVAHYHGFDLRDMVIENKELEEGFFPSDYEDLRT